MPTRLTNALRNLPAYLLLGAFALSTVFALLWMLMMSLKPNIELFEFGAWALPKHWAWDNYVSAWQQMRVGRYFLNSVLYTGVGTSGGVLLAACAAYYLARVQFRGRNAIYYLFLISLMLPGFLAMVPRYFLMRSFGLLDTYVAVFLVMWSSYLPFNLILLINFFETLPTELEEAALIDGASAGQIFLRVMLPLARPALVTVAIFNFLWQWNEFFTPLIYLRSPAKYPLALGLQLLMFTSNWSMQYTRLFAGMVMFTIPVVVVFLALRDQITQGLTVGALKG